MPIMKRPDTTAVNTRRPPAHVVKRMAPTQPGAIKLAEQYGERLVCVRYRHDATGHHRYTTVELIVAQAPVKPRTAGSAAKLQIVALRIPYEEADLRELVRAHGALWDRKARLWYIPRATARALGLMQRVV